MSRQDQYQITMSISGRSMGEWDKMSGGEIDSEETKYRPGSMAPQISLGGYSTVNNLNISRLYDLNRDHGLINFMIGQVGKGKVHVGKQPLDVNGNPFGRPMTYSGVLKQVTFPEVDSESADAGMIELEISSAATIA